MFKVKRNYGNGFEVEVEAQKMTEIIAKLAAADEIFLDVRCAAQINGKVEVSDKVKFTVRSAQTSDGRPCKYYEQVCVGPKDLAWFKRQMGVYQDSDVGGLFVKTKTELDPKCTPGLAGWSRYNGDNNQRQGGFASNAPQQTYSQQPPQQTYAQQTAPQQYQQPAPQQYQQPAPVYVPPSMDDIPF
jgi:hypothetical protein